MIALSNEGERRLYGEPSGIGIAGRAGQRSTSRFPASGPMLPLPLGETRPHDVGWLTRLAWIAGIAIGGALAFGALAAGVEALGRLFRG